MERFYVSNNPSVLFLNRVYPAGRGATGRVLQDLAKSFAKKGWQVTVITSAPKAAHESDGKITVIRVKGAARPSNMFAYMWIWLKMLFAGLRVPRNDLVVSMTDPPLLILVGSIIVKVKNSRHIHWCQDLYPDVLPALGIRIPSFLSHFLKKLSNKAMKRCDRIIVIGRCMARSLSYSSIDPRQITMIPNWPNFELIKKKAANSPGVKSKKTKKAKVVNQAVKPYHSLHKGDPKFRVLYAGNIGLAHPIDTILAAAEQLNDEQPDIEFVFVGDGPRYDLMAKERSERGLDNIRLIPFQPKSKLKELMQSGDVHLISMKEEAAGQIVPCKLYSALAVQRPCVFVGPENSEAAKVIHDFSAGTIVPQGQARELVEAIKTYRLSSDDWVLAHKGAAKAGKIYTPKDSIAAWIGRAAAVVKGDI